MSDPSSPSTPTVELPLEQRLQLRQAAERLKDRFAGQLNVETIERFLTDSFDQISDGARLPNWLPLLAERFAKERLRALVRLEAGPEVTTPAVLFLCVQNAGRSQMAAGWMRHLAGDRVDVFSGGSSPPRSSTVERWPRWPSSGSTSRTSCPSPGPTRSCARPTSS